MLTRRKFIKVGGVITMAGAMAPAFIAKTLDAAGSALSNNQKALVVVQLTGGNDGLNTLVPYSDDNYYKLRPTIGIPSSQVLKLDDQLGLNPGMQGLKSLWDAGQVGIIRGVGYPNPNYSHFRSMEIWQSGNPDQIVRSGWLGRYLDNQVKNDGSNSSAVGNSAMVIGDAGQGGGAPLAMWTEKTVVLSYNSAESFRFLADNATPNDHEAQLAAIKKIYSIATENKVADYIRTAALDALNASDQIDKIANSYKTNVNYPNTPFANRLKSVAELLNSDFGARIFYVATDGSFDTHFNENVQGSNLVGYHTKLIGAVSDALAAFYQDLAEKNLADNVLTLTFSEFGRRAAENGSHGTDHGSAEPMFVIGGKNAIKGGMYGAQPSLSDLDGENLKVQLDFRAVYATILKNWLHTDPTTVVSGNYTLLDFVRV